MAGEDHRAGAPGLGRLAAARDAERPRRSLVAATVAATVITLGALALFGFVAYLFNGVSNDTHGTLGIAQTATSKKAQQQQYARFIQTEQAIFLGGFRADCDAKAHQLAYLGQILGGKPDVAVLQAQCVAAIPPPPPLPTP